MAGFVGPGLAARRIGEIAAGETLDPVGASLRGEGAERAADHRPKFVKVETMFERREHESLMLLLAAGARSVAQRRNCRLSIVDCRMSQFGHGFLLFQEAW